MIAPFAKMRFSSIIWYQGESNANAAMKYRCSFPALIYDWRVKFGSPKLPFYFVVLAPCDGHKWCADFVNVRNAQLTGGLALPNTGYAVAVDLGDRNSPARSVHTRRKQEVGRRLALVALKEIYNKNVVPTGPVFESISASSGTLTVTYVAGTAETLHVSHTADANCTSTIVHGILVDSAFEVMLPSKNWVPVNYSISGSNVVIQVPPAMKQSSTLIPVRYGWVQWASCALYNGRGGPDDHAGIAATPFCWNGTAPCPVNG